jgi:hypothetical protein
MHDALYEDKTQSCIPGDSVSLFLFAVFGCMVFGCMVFGAGLISCVKFLISEKADNPGYLFLVASFYGLSYMLVGWVWNAFSFPMRVQSIRLQKDQILQVMRGVPYSAFLLGREDIRYGISWGNFSLDLNQRSNAPRGLNIWFDYRGQRFWIPEASANYREALYLLAEHAQLKFDPSLCRWERRWFWLRWRECRKRPEPEPEPVQAAVPVTPPGPIEPTPESLARNLDAQKPVGEEMAVPTIDGLRVGNATVQLRKGKATLIVPPRKS